MFRRDKCKRTHQNTADIGNDIVRKSIDHKNTYQWCSLYTDAMLYQNSCTFSRFKDLYVSDYFDTLSYNATS